MATKQTRTKLTAQCDCVDLVNDQLKEFNAALPTELAMNFKTGAARFVLTIPLRKRDSGSRKPLKHNKVVCAYCPFCGKKQNHKTKEAP